MSFECPKPVQDSLFQNGKIFLKGFGLNGTGKPREEKGALFSVTLVILPLVRFTISKSTIRFTIQEGITFAASCVRNQALKKSISNSITPPILVKNRICTPNVQKLLDCQII